MGATLKDGPSDDSSLIPFLAFVRTSRPVAANIAKTGKISNIGEAIRI